MGVTAGHATQGPRPVDAYELDTGHGLSIVVWTYGATLVEVRVPDRRGEVGNVVLRLPDLAAYERRLGNPYLGATVGRFCRNVAHGRFRLDGTEHRLDRNDKRNHHIHGGSIGFDRVVWDAEVRDDAVHLRHTSPDGDQGYPGELAAEAIYRVSDLGLTIEYRATTAASTIVGFTNHAYWNLAGRDFGGGTIDGQHLALNATRMLAFDAEFLPVAGPPAAVAGTPFDHTVARPLAGQRLDTFFVLDDPSWAAELADPAGGRVMRVVTDQPGIGVYTADRHADRRAGICLETGAWPDAPNRPDFPPVRLDPGMTYVSRTTHEFAVS